MLRGRRAQETLAAQVSRRIREGKLPFDGSPEELAEWDSRVTWAEIRESLRQIPDMKGPTRRPATRCREWACLNKAPQRFRTRLRIVGR